MGGWVCKEQAVMRCLYQTDLHFFKAPNSDPTLQQQAKTLWGN
jgi:hypothetical protein